MSLSYKISSIRDGSIDALEINIYTVYMLLSSF